MYRMYQFGLVAIDLSGYSAKIKGAIRASLEILRQDRENRHQQRMQRLNDDRQIIIIQVQRNIYERKCIRQGKSSNCR